MMSVVSGNEYTLLIAYRDYSSDLSFYPLQMETFNLSVVLPDKEIRENKVKSIINEHPT